MQKEPILQPRWIRFPRFGERCQFTGLTRQTLDFLTRPQPRNNFKPAVKSKKLKIEGSDPDRGMVLIDYASLMAWIEALPDNRRAKKIASAVAATAAARAAQRPKVTTPRRRKAKEVASV